jgi:hypothetical protein
MAKFILKIRVPLILWDGGSTTFNFVELYALMKNTDTLMELPLLVGTYLVTRRMREDYSS